MKYYWMVFVLLAGCNPDRNKFVNPDSPRFDTSASSEMFFKNVRKIYYSLSTDVTGREQFRMRHAKTDPTLPEFNLCIIADWKNDRAYILFEPNAVLGDTVLVRRSDTQEQFRYVPGPIENHYLFVSQLYGCIQQKTDLQVYAQGNWQNAFPTTAQRETFRKTLVDFYRLVGAL